VFCRGKETRTWVGNYEQRRAESVLRFSVNAAITAATTTQSERYAPTHSGDVNAQLRQLHASRSEANLLGANNGVSPQLADRVRQMNRGDRSSLEVQRSLRAVKAEADTVIHMLRAKNDLDESVEILDSDDVHSHRSRADSEFYGRYANSMPPPLGQEKIVWDAILALGPAMQVSVYKRLRLHLIQMSMIDEPISRSSSTTDVHAAARASSTSRGASPPPSDLNASPAPRPPSRGAAAAAAASAAAPAPRLSYQQQQQLREHLPWLQYDSEEAMETMKLLSLLEASHLDDDDDSGGGGGGGYAAMRAHRSPRARSPDGRRRQYYRHANSLGHTGGASGGGRSGSPPRRNETLHLSPIHAANARRESDRRPLSPRARRELSPRARRELSPRARRDFSPRRAHRELSPRRGRRELSPRGSRQEQSPRAHSPRGRRVEHSPRGSRPDYSPRGSRHEHSPRSSSPRGSSPRRRSPVRHPRAHSPRAQQGTLRGSGGGARSSASQSGEQLVGGANRRRPPT
jgi:hypothetical protein